MSLFLLRADRRSVALLLAAALAACLASWGASPTRGAAEIFTEMEDSGLDFVHFNGATGEYFLPEITCGGAAFLDYDNDGDLDVYLVQGQLLGEADVASALYPPADDVPLADRLYRNDSYLLPGGELRLRFVDVTDAGGILAAHYGCSATVGDFDNDGWVDLYLANLGPNQLWRNLADGTFEAVDLPAGLADDRWSIPTTWFDLDNDGWLDLFVGNYVEFDLANQKECRSQTGARDYCNPAAYLGVSDGLFHNTGEGDFMDISASSGLARPRSKSLGVVAADFNGDALPDLYVTNDGVPNQLWIQTGDGKFVDDAMLAGCAVNRQGRPEASMGVDAGDYDGDGDLDIFMTHLTGETNTLFLNDGQGLFEDRTVDTGLGPPSWRYTSWGLAWIDYDNDGLRDMAIVNGAVRELQELANAGDRYPFHQPNQLFRNEGGGRYTDVSSAAGQGFQHSEISRALVVGDLDNDGDADLLTVNLIGPTRLMINNVGQDGPWQGARLLGEAGPRDMIGARVELQLNEGRQVWRRVKTDGSFSAAHDPRVLVGLGTGTAVDALRAHWPDGRVTEIRSPPINRYLILDQGSTRIEP